MTMNQKHDHPGHDHGDKPHTGGDRCGTSMTFNNTVGVVAIAAAAALGYYFYDDAVRAFNSLWGRLFGM